MSSYYKDMQNREEYDASRFRRMREQEALERERETAVFATTSPELASESEIPDGMITPMKLMNPEPQLSVAFPTGMTLRDWFAGQALAAHTWSWNDDMIALETARRCYRIADAMMHDRDDV